MLKNTKVVGIAAAITLLTGVALAPSASAINGQTPTLTVDDDNYDAGTRINFDVTGVRTGCDVTTKVGSATLTKTAKHDNSYAASIIGWVNSHVKAPKVAGEYTVASMVSNSCATDPGYKRAADMAVDITVGTELDFEDDYEDSGAGDSQRIFGDIVIAGGSVNQDLNGVDVTFSVRGKVVARANTDGEGYVSAVVAGKYLNSRGNTRVTVSVEANKNYWLDYDVVVNP
jgi:hypothetical protein